MHKSANLFALLVLTFFFALSCGKNGPTSTEEPTITPNSPRLVTPANNAVNQPSMITLRWDSVDNASNYQIQVSTSTGFSGTLIDETGLSTVSYVASNLADETTYFWRVRAINGSESSDWSNVWSFKVEQLTTLSEGTKAIDESISDMISDTTSGLSTITFSGNNEFIRDLRSGDVIIAPVTEKLPYGALKKITQIEKSGNNTTVTTEDASLEEAIEEAEIDITQALSPSQVVKQNIYYEGVRLKSNKSNSGEFYLDLNNVVIYDGDGDLEATKNDQLRINGSISFTPTLNAYIKIQSFEIQEFDFSIEADYNSQLNIYSEVAGLNLKKRYKLAQYNLHHIVAGYVVIFPQIEIWVGAEGGISTGLTAGIEYQSDLISGINYDNGIWTPNSDFNQTVQFNPIDAKFGAQAQVYGAVDFIGLLYGGIGPYVKLKGYLETKVDLLSNPWWQLFWGVESGVGVKVKLLYKDIADYELPSVIGYRHMIAEADGPKETPVLSYSPSSFDLQGSSGSTTIMIDNTGNGTLNWKLSSTADWISLNPSIGTNAASVEVSYEENTTSSLRSTEIIISSNSGEDESILVEQNNKNNISYEDFGITSDRYSEKSDWAQIVLDNFGDQYRVADWNDLKEYYNNGGDLLVLFDELGLTDYGNSASVTRNGVRNYSTDRYYFASRHEGNKPGNYLAHDNINNYQISLGSWWGERPIMVIKKN